MIKLVIIRKGKESSRKNRNKKKNRLNRRKITKITNNQRLRKYYKRKSKTKSKRIKESHSTQRNSLISSHINLILSKSKGESEINVKIELLWMSLLCLNFCKLLNKTIWNSKTMQIRT